MTLRLDQALMSAGLARSRAHAKTLIEGGAVQVRGQTMLKPATAVSADDELTVSTSEDDQWVGRGALKLVRAMTLWGDDIPVTGARCLDIGASTGGFTQVLLAHGAAEVVALDVGHGQLAPLVRDDPRVVERSGVNIRDVRPGDLGLPFDLIVVDVSFISLTLVLPAAARLLQPKGRIVVLIKPQFEIGRERLGRTGVVKSAQQRAEAITTVTSAMNAAQLAVGGVSASAVVGGTGNHEYLAWGWPYAGADAGARPQALDPTAVAQLARQLGQEVSS